MKSTVATILALLFVSGLLAIDVSGIQSGTWSPANNPYRLTGDVTIPAGSVLTIEPGVIVQATGNFRINAEGSIQAVGTETDSIRFENDQNPPTNLWKGIRLENDTEVSNCMHIVVEYGSMASTRWILPSKCLTAGSATTSAACISLASETPIPRQ